MVVKSFRPTLRVSLCTAKFSMDSRCAQGAGVRSERYSVFPNGNLSIAIIFALGMFPSRCSIEDELE